MKDLIEESDKKYIIGIVITVIIVLLLILFRVGCVRTVKSGEVGIKVRFGKVVDTRLNDGINLKLPFVEKIVKMNIKVQKIELDSNSASKDLQDVNMKVAVNYRVDGKKATDLYKNIGTKYSVVVLEPAIQESIKAVTSRYAAEELITNRSEVSTKCMEELDKKIKKYGLSVDNFNIINFSFSEEFNKAIEEKQVAEQKVLTAKQNLEKAKVEAEQKIVEAEGERRANELKQQSLTQNIIEEQFIEKWDGKLPVVTGSNNIMDVSSFIGG